MMEMRPYCPGDEEKILELFQLSFGRELTEAAWAWRYRDNPAGKGIIELCWDGDSLAAHYSVAQSITRIGGHDCRTALSGTTMTHPDYRGCGLFPKLAQRVYCRARELGVVMVRGFPNRLSHRGFVRDLGWEDVYEVPTFRLPEQSLSGGNVVELAGLDSRFDRLWRRVRDRHAVSTKRDAAYLQWRYVQNPMKYRILAHVIPGEVLGYAVVRRHQDELHVVDMLALNDQAGEQLIRHAAGVAREDGASSLSLWLGVTQSLHWRLERLGFRNEGPTTYFSALVLRDDLLDVHDFSKWYLTMGDSDVY